MSIVINPRSWVKIGNGSMVVLADSITEYILFADSNFNIFDGGYCNLKRVNGFGDVYAKSTTANVSLEISSGGVSDTVTSDSVSGLPIAPKANMVLVSFNNATKIEPKWVSMSEFKKILETGFYYSDWSNLSNANNNITITNMGDFSATFNESPYNLRITHSKQSFKILFEDENGKIHEILLKSVGGHLGYENYKGRDTEALSINSVTIGTSYEISVNLNRVILYFGLDEYGNIGKYNHTLYESPVPLKIVGFSGNKSEELGDLKMLINTLKFIPDLYEEYR